jgi:hypothetical protein
MTAPVERAIPPAVVTRIGNPVLRTLLRSPLHGVVDRQFLLLHVPGRRSGRVYDIVVAHHDLPEGRTVFTNSRWRANLRGGVDLDLTWQGRRRRAHADLVEDPEVVADTYAGRIAEFGWEGAQRRLGIRITVGRAPTREELLDAVRTLGLSLVRLDVA